jgi:hypothetical protein
VQTSLAPASASIWFVVHEPRYDIHVPCMQVPYEEYPLIHTRQNPSWDQFKQRGAAVLRYGDHFQRVRNSSAAEVPTLWSKDTSMINLSG